MHPNLSVGQHNVKQYDLNNQNKKDYKIDRMNQQSPERITTENPESQD
jgi:hypothetical protein